LIPAPGPPGSRPAPWSVLNCTGPSPHYSSPVKRPPPPSQPNGCLMAQTQQYRLSASRASTADCRWVDRPRSSGARNKNPRRQSCPGFKLPFRLAPNSPLSGAPPIFGVKLSPRKLSSSRRTGALPIGKL